MSKRWDEALRVYLAHAGLLLVWSLTIDLQTAVLVSATAASLRLLLKD